MKLIITVDEDVYREAISAGWNERFGEELNPNDIGSFDDKCDLIWAIPNLSENDFELEVKE